MWVSPQKSTIILINSILIYGDVELNIVFTLNIYISIILFTGVKDIFILHSPLNLFTPFHPPY